MNTLMCGFITDHYYYKTALVIEQGQILVNRFDHRWAV